MIDSISLVSVNSTRMLLPGRRQPVEDTWPSCGSGARRDAALDRVQSTRTLDSGVWSQIVCARAPAASVALDQHADCDSANFGCDVVRRHGRATSAFIDFHREDRGVGRGAERDHFIGVGAFGRFCRRFSRRWRPRWPSTHAADRKILQCRGREVRLRSGPGAWRPSESTRSFVQPSTSSRLRVRS